MCAQSIVQIHLSSCILFASDMQPALALSRHSAWPLVLGRLALSTSQRLAAGARRSPALVFAHFSPWLLKPSASPSLALDLHLVTLLPLVCFHACLHACKCVSALLLPTGIAIPRSSAAWSHRHTPVDPRHSAAQALLYLCVGACALVLCAGRSHTQHLESWAINARLLPAPTHNCSGSSGPRPLPSPTGLGRSGV
jgi:hypothetical protein